ncbi:MAG: hypothetical protein IKP34_03970 [Bacteroidales bacterium]|nr:hypothetical protein [Bacteroidales bacterium]MBR4715313.1 hypothetical protein [Bacteroidales bacterium]
MEKLNKATNRWWFAVVLVVIQSVLLPFASQNFSFSEIGGIISATLSNAPQTHLGCWNILFQSLSLLILIMLCVCRGKVRTFFNGYVAISYVAFAFIQNVAVTERYGFSMVTVNLAMFLFVAYVWICETLRPENVYDFSNFKWKYVWMIILALFAYLCPFDSNGTLDFNPIHFFERNTATAFCLTTPLFLTILTLNLPKVNIVTYRITAIIGFIIGCYNMMPFLNPSTVYVGIVHLPLLIISLYCIVLSYSNKVWNTEPVAADL